MKKYTEKFALTESEIHTAGLIAKSLTLRHVGRDNAIHKDEIIAKLKEKSIEVNKDKLSEMIQYIRVYNMCGCLLELSQGYFISTNEEELSNYLIVLKAKSDELLRMKKALEQQIHLNIKES